MNVARGDANERQRLLDNRADDESVMPINDVASEDGSGEYAAAMRRSTAPSGSFARLAAKQKDVNIFAMFLHVLGDVLSSIVVLIEGLLLRYFDRSSWAKYVDPLASLIIIVIVLASTLPLLRRISSVLMQAAPASVNIDGLLTNLRALPHVDNVHDLHVWSMVTGTVIATLHVNCALEQVPHVSAAVRSTCHAAGIHSVTVQCEPNSTRRRDASGCESRCVVGCTEKKCC